MQARVRRPTGILLVTLALCAPGCVERLLKVRSDPPGAVVFLNGEEVGATPLDHRFGFYGTVAVVLRREGHESVRVAKRLDPPWYEYFPLDFFAENLIPWTIEDHHTIEARLSPRPEEVDLEVEETLEKKAVRAREEAERPLAPEKESGG